MDPAQPDRSQNLIPTEDVISKAKSLGVKFGFGDENNRIRYLIKNSLLPHQTRKFKNGRIVAHLPETAIDRLVEIQKLQDQLKYTIPQLVEHFNDENVKQARKVYEGEDFNIDTPQGQVSLTSLNGANAEASYIDADDSVGVKALPVESLDKDEFDLSQNSNNPNTADNTENSDISQLESVNDKADIAIKHEILGQESGLFSEDSGDLEPAKTPLRSRMMNVVITVVTVFTVLAAVAGVYAFSTGQEESLLARMSSLLENLLGNGDGVINNQLAEVNTSVDQSSLNIDQLTDDIVGQVLSSLVINIPTEFKGDITASNIDLNFNGSTLNVGGLEADTITADNILYSIIAGDGIELSGTQDVTIVNSGVLSLGGETGDIELQEGSGITIDGTEITNTGVTSFAGETGDVELVAGADIDINGLSIALQSIIDTVSQIIFPSGGILDLSAISHDTSAIQGFKLPQNTSFVAVSSGEGYLAWDSDHDKLVAFDGTSWNDVDTVVLADSLDYDDFIDAMTLDATTTVNFFDGTNTHDYRFFNSNTSAEIFYMDGNGLIGIGTTNPLASLDAPEILTDALTLSPGNTLSGLSGFNTYVNFSQGVGTNGLVRLTSEGDLTNIRSIGANNIHLRSGGTFASAADYSTVASPLSATSDDFNGDGYIDLAIVGSDTVSVLINNGDGTFAAKVDYSIVSSLMGVSSGDVDGDGYIDIVTSSRSTNAVYVLLNNGDGTFANEVEYAVETLSAGSKGLGLADFNRDGRLDIAVTQGTDGTIGILLNNGDGTYGSVISYAVETNPIDLDLGDVDGNGSVDVVASTDPSNGVSVLLNNGDGTFAASVNYSASSSPFGVSLADVDLDGQKDIITAQLESGGGVSVLLNEGDGTFAAKVNYSTSAWPRYVATADFNGDGYPDIVTVNQTSSSVSVLLNDKDGTFGTNTQYGIGSTPLVVLAADLNNDTLPDIVSVNFGDSDISVLLNNPSTLLYADAHQGSIGIGTSSPSGRLQITGDEVRIGDGGTVDFATGDGDLYVEDALEVDGAFYLGGTQITSTGMELNLLDGATATAGGVVFGNGTNFTQDASNFFWDDTNNYLGLGTNTPSSLLSLYSTSTSSSFGGFNLDWQPGSATTLSGDLFSINIGANGSAANLFAIYDNNSPIFTVGETSIESAVPHAFTAAGDVSMSYDLNFTNSTAAYINFDGPGYIRTYHPSGNYDLTLSAANDGQVIINDNFKLYNADPSIVFDTLTSTDTDFWMGVIEDAGGDDDDKFMIGDGTTVGTNPFLTIDTSGNLGIGTTAPTHALEVLGNTQFQTSTDSTSAFQWLDADGGTSILNIDATNERVGIGIDSPSQALHVYRGTTSAEVEIGSGQNDAYAQLVARNNSSSVVNYGILGSAYPSSGVYQAGQAYNVTNSAGFSIGTLNASGVIRLYSGNGVEAMRVSSAGNVGIGTTNPSGRLQIAGDEVRIGAAGTLDFASADGDLYVQDALEVDGNAYLSSLYLGGTQVTATAAELNILDGVTSTASELNYLDGTTVTTGGVLFGNGTNITHDSTNFFWDDTSNSLGIGTNSPNYKLDIVSSDTTGLLELTGNSITTGTGVSLSLDGLTSGTGFLVESDGSNTISGDLFKLRIGASTSVSGNIFAIYDDTTPLFTVTQTGITSALPHSFTAAGDVSFAYDTVYTNQTASTIKSYGPLTIESGEAFENLDLTLKPSGSGSVIIDDGSDLELYTGEALIFDTDDSGDSYMTHDATNDRVQVFVDGTEMFRFDSGGNESNGAITSDAFDLAESYPTMDKNLEAGDVVSIIGNANDEETISKYLVAKADPENMSSVLGVVSSRPGFRLGGGSFSTEFCADVTTDEGAARSKAIAKELSIIIGNQVAKEIASGELKVVENATQEDLLDTKNTLPSRQKVIDERVADILVDDELLTETLGNGLISAIDDKIQACKSVKHVDVALAGRVPVKYDNSNGEIKAGDLLTSSTVSFGKAAKLTSKGWAIGRALEDSEEGKDTIMMYVMLSWHTGDNDMTLAYASSNQVLSASNINYDALNQQLASITKVDTGTDGKKRLAVYGNMNVLGTVTGFDIATSGTVTAGFIKIDGATDTINVVGGGELKLQSGEGPIGNIEAFNGKLVMTTDGGIISKATIEADTLAAREFKVLGASETKDSSVGEGEFESGRSEVTINNNLVKESSKVFVTLIGETGGRSISIKEKKDGSFVAKLSSSANGSSIKFDYWIVGVEQ